MVSMSASASSSTAEVDDCLDALSLSLSRSSSSKAPCISFLFIVVLTCSRKPAPRLAMASGKEKEAFRRKDEFDRSELCSSSSSSSSPLLLSSLSRACCRVGRGERARLVSLAWKALRAREKEIEKASMSKQEEEKRGRRVGKKSRRSFFLSPLLDSRNSRLEKKTIY